MSFTVFLGNLPSWVTDDDIKSWLESEGLIADSIKVIRNPRTQESRGFAFIEAPNEEEMYAIIRRFNRAPLENRLLRANPAYPPGQRPRQPAGRRQQPAQAQPSTKSPTQQQAAGSQTAAAETQVVQRRKARLQQAQERAAKESARRRKKQQKPRKKHQEKRQQQASKEQRQIPQTIMAQKLAEILE